MGPVSGVAVFAFPGASITTSGTSASATIPNAQDGNAPKYVYVVATAAAWVRFGKGAQTAVAGDLLVQPGDAVIAAIGGADTVAALQVAAAGVVGISAVESA